MDEPLPFYFKTGIDMTRDDGSTGDKKVDPELELLRRVWEGDYEAAPRVTISSKGKQALKDLLHKYGVTDMPAIDALPVDDSEQEVSTSAAGEGAGRGRLQFFRICNALAHGLAIKADELAGYAAALVQPRLQLGAGAVRRTSSDQGVSSAVALDWYVVRARMWQQADRSGQAELTLKTDRPTGAAESVAVIGWYPQALARFARAAPGVPEGSVSQDDIVVLWDGTVTASIETTLSPRVSFDLPRGSQLSAEVDHTGVPLVRDGTGKWVACLQLERSES